MAYFPPYINETGIHMPTYEDRLEDLCSAYRSIFGQEAELTPAVPDYQLLSVFAKALDDTSALVLAGYNSRNPAYASGQALDLLLPQYGIVRQPGESDASARARMNLSLASRGLFTTDAMEAAIREVPGVTHVLIRVNSGGSAADGIPAHSVAALVNNGSAGPVAEAIFRKKPPGIGTYGSITRQVNDGRGNSVPISFSRPTMLLIQIHVKVRPYDGFDETAVRTAVTDALMTFFNTELQIGEAVTIPRLYGLLYQAAGEYASTFAITDLAASGSFGVEREKIVPAWNEKYSLNQVVLEVLE